MLAIETLSWMEMRRLSEPLAFARTVKQLGIDNHDSLRLAHMLVSETIRRRNFIDKFINNIIKPATITEYAFGIQAFLRLYVYQMRMAKNWSNPSLKEAENIAKIARSILGWKTLIEVEPFLGMLLTENSTTVSEDANDEERLAIQTFHPTWFIRYCLRIFGRSQTLAILEANAQPPPTYIRLNTLRAEEKEILERLSEEGVRLEKVPQLHYLYRVTAAGGRLTRTSSFIEGRFAVQDKATCFPVEAAGPRPGMIVSDICAAPGAKTTHLAQLMRNQGSILSVDYSKSRIAAWKIEIKRMGAEIAEPIIADARNPLPFIKKADIVVLDPPSTDTGTFGKMPSAKWWLSPRSIERMAQIQWQMLDKHADQVKLGGILIYSTCSITVEENEMLVERLLKQRPEFSLSEITPRIGAPGLRGLHKCQRLYPHTDRCNGLFIAKLSKDKNGN